MCWTRVTGHGCPVLPPPGYGTDGAPRDAVTWTLFAVLARVGQVPPTPGEAPRSWEGSRCLGTVHAPVGIAWSWVSSFPLRWGQWVAEYP